MSDNNIDNFINKCLDESWAKMCEPERKKEWLKLLDGRARSERALLEARAQADEYLSEWRRERKELNKAVGLLRRSVIFLRECWQTSDSDTDSDMVDEYHEINNFFEKHYEEPSEL